MKSYGQNTDFPYVYIVTLTLRYDLKSRSWHTLWSWTTNVWNIIQNKHNTYNSYGLDKDHGYVCNVTLTLEI